MKTFSTEVLFFVLLSAAVSCKHAGAAAAKDAGPPPAERTIGSSAATATATPTPTGASTTTAACSAVGSFGAHVTTSHGPGTTALVTGADDSFSLTVTLDANHATTALKGTYSTSGDQITFVNSSGGAASGRRINGCIGVKGVYAMAWSADCKQVTLHKVSDACPPREQEADGTTLSRR
jgi:hypothetical protein